jgi:hypothetical protein
MSTSCGWAVLDDNVIVEKGLINVKDDFTPDRSQGLIEDFFFIEKADQVSNGIRNLICRYFPDFIYIEQTNSGSFRTSQKMLEFIHYSVLKMIREIDFETKVRYVDTSAWRGKHKIYMSKDDKKNNRSVSEGKKRGRITKKHLAVRWANENFNLALKLKDNDIAEALAIASYGHSNEIKRHLTPKVDLDQIFKTGTSHD